MIPKPINITVRLYFKNGKVQTIQTHHRKRLLYRIQATNSANIKKYYLHVFYGKAILPDINGETGFVLENEGEYTKRKDFRLAYAAFTGKEEVVFHQKYWGLL